MRKRIHEHFRRKKEIFKNQLKLEEQFMASPLDCLLIYESECASKHYRVDHAALCFEELGLSCRMLNVRDLDKISSFDCLRHVKLIIFHRLPMNPSLNKLLGTVQKFPTRTIMDLDDAIHDPFIYEQSAVFDHLDDIEKTLHRDMARRVAKTLGKVDHVTVSTDYLKKLIHLTDSNVTTVPNRISRSMMEEVKLIKKTTGNSVVIGYMSGTNTHSRDFRPTLAALDIILKQFDDVVLQIAGPLQLPNDFQRSHETRIKRLNLTSWPAFLRYYLSIDINLAPLEPDNIFCLAKSGIKYLEAALSATPTIASPTPDFKRLITHSRTGFLASSGEEWIDCLKTLILNRELRNETGQQAKQQVLDAETVSSNTCIWKQILIDLGIFS